MKENKGGLKTDHLNQRVWRGAGLCAYHICLWFTRAPWTVFPASLHVLLAVLSQKAAFSKNINMNMTMELSQLKKCGSNRELIQPNPKAVLHEAGYYIQEVPMTHPNLSQLVRNSTNTRPQLANKLPQLPVSTGEAKSRHWNLMVGGSEGWRRQRQQLGKLP